MAFLEGLQPIPVPDGTGLKSRQAKKFKLSVITKSKTNPVFSYRYLSLDKKDFCYNNPQITIDDFYKLFEIKKELSGLTFDRIETNPKYHFHQVENKRINPLLAKFKQTIQKEFGNDKVIDLPEIYQFALYSGTGNDKAPRVFGFIGQEGIFHIVWLVLYHTIYPSTTPRKKRV